jgi:hypothetical protein
MPPQHFREIGITLGREDSDGVTGRPEKKPGDPHPKSQTESRCNRPIYNGERARRSR